MNEIITDAVEVISNVAFLGNAEHRMRQLGIELPNIPTPIANFIPFRRDGNLVFLAGQICEWNGTVRYRGKMGIDHYLEDGQEAARICALNLLAALRQACDGSLDRVSTCLRVGGFVNCAPDYDKVPQVVDGASNLMHALFGESGRHARTAIGVASLPQRATVEVDAVFSVR
jgi:enamine deaminase RidA (YjgF/YER057c/UK114 family)